MPDHNRLCLYVLRQGITHKGGTMAQVGIVMGSDSDLSVMSKAAEVLDEFGITESLISFLTGLRAQKREGSRSSLPEQEWPHTFPECAPLCFRCL